MHSASLFLAALLGTVTACSAVGGGDSTQAASSACRARVVLQMTAVATGTAKDELLASLARDTGIALKLIAEVSDTVLTVEMSATGSCESALDSLRRDSRVRAADLDARRKHHAS